MSISITCYTPKHQIKGFLFDLDGTLINTAPDIIGALNDVLAEYHLPQSEYQTLMPFAGEGSLKLLERSTKLAADSAEFKTMQAKLIAQYRTRIWQDSHLFAGIDSLLELLDDKNIPWGIVTNKPSFLTLPLVQKLNWQNRVKSVVCPDTINQQKPHPAPMLHAAKELAIKPQNCIMIGDHKRDIQAAHNSNMASIIAKYGYITEPDLTTWQADAIAQNVEEIIKWTQKTL